MAVPVTDFSRALGGKEVLGDGKAGGKEVHGGIHARGEILTDGGMRGGGEPPGCGSLEGIWTA
jgi:hypothetical protein